MKLEFHPEAEEELLEAVSRYEVQMPGLGERFAAEVRAASALLLEYPEMARLQVRNCASSSWTVFPIT
jgi:hypothetical protein